MNHEEDETPDVLFFPPSFLTVHIGPLFGKPGGCFPGSQAFERGLCVCWSRGGMGSLASEVALAKV